MLLGSRLSEEVYPTYLGVLRRMGMRAAMCTYHATLFCSLESGITPLATHTILLQEMVGYRHLRRCIVGEGVMRPYLSDAVEEFMFLVGKALAQMANSLLSSTTSVQTSGHKSTAS
jgi:hypothetical protein